MDMTEKEIWTRGYRSKSYEKRFASVQATLMFSRTLERLRQIGDIEE
jgi:hypothetical protein